MSNEQVVASEVGNGSMGKAELPRNAQVSCDIPDGGMPFTEPSTDQGNNYVKKPLKMTLSRAQNAVLNSFQQIKGLKPEKRIGNFFSSVSGAGVLREKVRIAHEEAEKYRLLIMSMPPRTPSKR